MSRIQNGKTGYKPTYGGKKVFDGNRPTFSNQRKDPFVLTSENDEKIRRVKIIEQILFGAYVSKRGDKPIKLDGNGKNFLDFKGKDPYGIVIPSGYGRWYCEHSNDVRFAKSPYDTTGGEHLLQPIPNEWPNTFKSSIDFMKWVMKGENVDEYIEDLLSIHATILIRSHVIHVFFENFEDVGRSMKRFMSLRFGVFVEEFTKQLASKTTHQKELIEQLTTHVHKSHLYNSQRTPFENLLIIMMTSELSLWETFRDAKEDIVYSIQTICFVLSRPIMVVFNTATKDDIEENELLDENSIVGVWVRPLILNSPNYKIPAELLQTSNKKF